MRKLILRQDQSPGDIVMLTAAVRDLHSGYPGMFQSDVRTPCPALWEYNPYLTPLDERDPEVETIDCHYPLVHRSNQAPYHFIHGFIDFLNDQLLLKIKPTRFHGDIHLSDLERERPSQVRDLTGQEVPFWIIVSGGKYDFTAKWWDATRFQAVVDHYQSKVLFVQVGENGHHHPPLRGVINLVGKTDLRQLVQLVYHAQGVLTTVNLLMHLAAAVEVKGGRPKNRPCVVIAGGREPAQWEAYPHHQYLHTNGALFCCDNGGCWKSRVVPLGDGDEKDSPPNLCVDVVGRLPRCMDMISAEDVIRCIDLYFEGGAARHLTEAEWQAGEQALAGPASSASEICLNQMTAPTLSEQFIASIPPYPGNFTGRGIVICGGGVTYFTCAWVCIRMLRRLGCSLPIQLWHLGARELDARMAALIAPFQVTCVDATEVRKRQPARILNGWELKPYSLLHSPFKEILLLDADNVVITNPEFLFETPQFLQTGAIFWPDLGRLGPNRPIWELCGVPFGDEPEFESGQLVVDKERCWRPLSLAMWYNEHSDFYYRFVHGDKETFHLAFRRLRQPYAMPPFPVQHLDGVVMCQHDFQGRRVFQHRNLSKWRLFADNQNIADFWNEGECLTYLAELRGLWDGRIGANPVDSPERSEAERKAARQLTEQLFEYHRVGYDRRLIRLLPNGTLGVGADVCERFWDLVQEKDGFCLRIVGEQGATCNLKLWPDGVWRGRWLCGERMPVELIPKPEAER